MGRGSTVQARNIRAVCAWERKVAVSSTPQVFATAKGSVMAASAEVGSRPTSSLAHSHCEAIICSGTMMTKSTTTTVVMAPAVERRRKP